MVLTKTKQIQLKKMKGDLRKLGVVKNKLARAQITRSNIAKKQAAKDNKQMEILNDKIWRLNGKIDMLK